MQLCFKNNIIEQNFVNVYNVQTGRVDPEMSRANAKTRVKKNRRIESLKVVQSITISSLARSALNYFERFDFKKSSRLDLGVESNQRGDIITWFDDQSNNVYNLFFDNYNDIINKDNLNAIEQTLRMQDESVIIKKFNLHYFL